MLVNKLRSIPLKYRKKAIWSKEFIKNKGNNIKNKIIYQAYADKFKLPIKHTGFLHATSI